MKTLKQILEHFGVKNHLLEEELEKLFTPLSDEELVKICESYDEGDHFHLDCLSDEQTHFYHGYRAAESRLLGRMGEK